MDINAFYIHLRLFSIQPPQYQKSVFNTQSKYLLFHLLHFFHLTLYHFLPFSPIPLKDAAFYFNYFKPSHLYLGEGEARLKCWHGCTMVARKKMQFTISNSILGLDSQIRTTRTKFISSPPKIDGKCSSTVYQHFLL